MSRTTIEAFALLASGGGACVFLALRQDGIALCLGCVCVVLIHAI